MHCCKERQTYIVNRHHRNCTFVYCKIVENIHFGEKRVFQYYFHTWKAEIENVNTIDERRSKSLETEFFDCHLSHDWRQMAMENTVSSDF